MVQCGICHEDPLPGGEIAELDCCFHRFDHSYITVVAAAVRLELLLPLCENSSCGGPSLSLQDRDESSSSCCRFCFPCISQWAKLATICPFDRQAFRSVKRKRLDPAALQGPDNVELGALPGKVLETLHYEERQQVCRLAQCSCNLL